MRKRTIVLEVRNKSIAAFTKTPIGEPARDMYNEEKIYRKEKKKALQPFPLTRGFVGAINHRGTKKKEKLCFPRCLCSSLVVIVQQH